MSTSGKMTPDDVLRRVIETIGDRRTNYGDPAFMFDEIAERWTRICVMPMTSRTVALMMADLKLARLGHKWDEDSAFDAIAYLAFAVMFANADD